MASDGFAENGERFFKLQEALQNKAERLKQIFSTRVEDSVLKLQAPELQSLEGLVTALETQLDRLEEFADEEMQEIPKVETLQKALRKQVNHVDFIGKHLPSHLPAFQQQHQTEPHENSNTAQIDNQQNPSNQGLASVNHQQQKEVKDVPPARPKPKKPQLPPAAPRNFVSEKELASVSSYMRGRLTLNKVNECVEEIAAHGENRAKSILSLRSGGGRKLTPEERKNALELMHTVGKHENVQNRYWFEENDLKSGNVLKLDKTGKSILTLLRHLGRINEMRITVEKSTRIIYIIM